MSRNFTEMYLLRATVGHVLDEILRGTGSHHFDVSISANDTVTARVNGDCSTLILLLEPTHLLTSVQLHASILGNLSHSMALTLPEQPHCTVIIIPAPSPPPPFLPPSPSPPHAFTTTVTLALSGSSVSAISLARAAVEHVTPLVPPVASDSPWVVTTKEVTSFNLVLPLSTLSNATAMAQLQVGITVTASVLSPYCS